MICDSEYENIKSKQLKVIECQISRLKEISDYSSIINLNSNRENENRSQNDNDKVNDNDNDNYNRNINDNDIESVDFNNENFNDNHNDQNLSHRFKRDRSEKYFNKFSKKYFSNSADKLYDLYEYKSSSNKLVKYMDKINKIYSKENIKSYKTKNFKMVLMDNDNENDDDYYNENNNNNNNYDNENYINNNNYNYYSNYNLNINNNDYKNKINNNINKKTNTKDNTNRKIHNNNNKNNNNNNNNKNKNKEKKYFEDIGENNNNNNNNNILKHKKSFSISNRQIKKIKINNSSEVDILKENEVDVNLNSSFFEEINISDNKSSIKMKIKNFWNNVLKLIKQKVYIFCVLAVAVFNFISTAIQYWVSDHLSKVMKFEENEIFICFVITCVTAPALGVISGGYVVQKIGGYEVKKAILICLLFSIIASINGIFIIIPENILGFSIVLWIYLFFGGAIIPNLIGKDILNIIKYN